jgi:hypothetical protein
MSDLVMRRGSLPTSRKRDWAALITFEVDIAAFLSDGRVERILDTGSFMIDQAGKMKFRAETATQEVKLS